MPIIKIVQLRLFLLFGKAIGIIGGSIIIKIVTNQSHTQKSVSQLLDGKKANRSTGSSLETGGKYLIEQRGSPKLE
jgi:hypothetical protein